MTEFIDLLDDIRKQAFDACMELSEPIIASQLGSDGEAFGDHPLDRGQRIARVQDMAARGVMDRLKVISPQTYKLLLDNFVKDVSESPLVGTSKPAKAGADQMAETNEDVQEWFGLDDMPKGEVETEPVYQCDPSKLPPLNPPWFIVQGYRDPEHSLRLIPSRRMAFARLKVPGIATLSRDKTSVPQDYDEAVRVMLTLPRIAVKERYVVRDDGGRAWLIDHILTRGGTWLAETELQDDTPPTPPPFGTRQLTYDPLGFTYSFSVPMGEAEINKWIAEAAAKGSRGPYSPSENPSFQWQQNQPEQAEVS